jgi:hypothetical protein
MEGAERSRVGGGGGESVPQWLQIRITDDEQDQDPHYGEKRDPAPHYSDADA